MRGVLGLAVVLAVTGCHNCDLVEAELRTREHELYDLHSELRHLQLDNEVLRREIAASPGPTRDAECASESAAVTRLVLGRLTESYDTDTCGATTSLQVVLEPRDPEGRRVRAPGSVAISALEILPEGIKAPLDSWDIAPDALRKSWRDGAFLTGYRLVLPWSKCPSSAEVRVIARLTLADGRVFEAEKDITVRPAVAAHPSSIETGESFGCMPDLRARVTTTSLHSGPARLRLSDAVRLMQPDGSR